MVEGGAQSTQGNAGEGELTVGWAGLESAWRRWGGAGSGLVHGRNVVGLWAEFGGRSGQGWSQWACGAGLGRGWSGYDGRLVVLGSVSWGKSRLELGKSVGRMSWRSASWLERS